MQASQDNSCTPEEEYGQHVAELQKEWEGKQSVSHMRMLLKQTRQNRRAWQQQLEPGKFAEIVLKFPCFEEGSFVLHEFFCMKNPEDTAQVRDEINSNMTSLFRRVAAKNKQALKGTEDMKSITLLAFLEDIVNKKKGKGQKSKSCYKLIKDVQSVDNIQDGWLATEPLDPPKLVILVNEGEILCIYVVGDNTKILTQTKSVFDSLVVLLAVYYVFDLEYPTIYAQYLGILQQWVIGDSFTSTKTTNWIKFSDELSRSGFST